MQCDRALRLSLAGLILASVACGDGRSPHFLLVANDSTLWSPRSTLERRVVSLDSAVEWSRWSDAADTVLLRPFRVRATASRIYVLDGTGFVAALDSAGRLLWKHGRRGSGPHEFLRVRDLEVTPHGGVAVLDVENARVALLDSMGAPAASVRVPEDALPQEFLPLGGGRILYQTLDPQAMFVVVDSETGAIARFTLPWKGVASLHPLVLQGSVSNLDGGRWVFGFGSGNGWFAFSDTASTGVVGHYAEHADFPDVVQRVSATEISSRVTRNVVTAQDLSVYAGQLFVLYGGDGQSRFRLVDVFNYFDGRYAVTYGLPVPAVAISVVGTRLYAIVQNEDGYPGLIAFRVPSPSDPK